MNIQRTFTQNFEIYYNNEGSARWLGIGSVDLPELSPKTVSINGAGLAGEIDMSVPAMFESLETTIHWRTIHEDLTCLSAPVSHDLTFRSVQPNYNAGTGDLQYQPVKIALRGLTKKTALGKFEQAAETDSESTLEVVYLKVTVDGTDLIELDKFNYIFKVNGTDYLENTRTGLGL